MPSILILAWGTSSILLAVLNLVINGMPSILKDMVFSASNKVVLNLVINGMPSILNP